MAAAQCAPRLPEAIHESCDHDSIRLHSGHDLIATEKNLAAAEIAMQLNLRGPLRPTVESPNAVNGDPFGLHPLLQCRDTRIRQR